MYERYFRLTRAPFSLALEPDFLYYTVEHREALAALVYSITSHKGFVVLTGEVGTGKSTIIRAALRNLVASHGDRFRFCLIVNPNLSADDLLDFVLTSFGERNIPAAKSQRLIRFQEMLLQAREAGHICCIVIDEAQRMSPDVLEEVRLWTNLETSENKLLQIVLAGQTEFDVTLSRPDLRQLKQRVAVRVSFGPLAPEDVKAYIEHRWKIAGGQLPTPFTPRAIEAVTFWSTGIPRLINSVCDNALLVSFATENRQVTAREISEAAADLDLRVSGTAPAEPEELHVPATSPPAIVTVEKPPERTFAEAAPENGNVPASAAVEGNRALKRWAMRLGLSRLK